MESASALMSLDLLLEISLPANPVTVGAAADPPKSPPNWMMPLALIDASFTESEAIEFCTNAVVATWVEFVPFPCVTAIVVVGNCGEPVKMGEFLSAFAFKSAAKAVPNVA